MNVSEARGLVRVVQSDDVYVSAFKSTNSQMIQLVESGNRLWRYSGLYYIQVKVNVLSASPCPLIRNIVLLACCRNMQNSVKGINYPWEAIHNQQSYKFQFNFFEFYIRPRRMIFRVINNKKRFCLSISKQDRNATVPEFRTRPHP